MARWREEENPVPLELARFDPADWPGPDAPGRWGAAARAWLEANPGRELPLAADGLEVRARVVALRRELAEAGHLAPGPVMTEYRSEGRDGQ